MRPRCDPYITCGGIRFVISKYKQTGLVVASSRAEGMQLSTPATSQEVLTSETESHRGFPSARLYQWGTYRHFARLLTHTVSSRHDGPGSCADCSGGCCAGAHGARAEERHGLRDATYRVDPRTAQRASCGGQHLDGPPLYSGRLWRSYPAAAGGAKRFCPARRRCAAAFSYMRFPMCKRRVVRCVLHLRPWTLLPASVHCWE